MEYAKCLVELDEILRYLTYEDLIKIPYEIRKAIKEQKDKDYQWNYDETKSLNEQNINRKTIAMLSYLNMEYLMNPEQKELMKKIHRANEEKLENEHLKKYNPDNLFKSQDKVKENISNAQNLPIEIKKKNVFEKIIDFIKSIFQLKN